MLGVAREEARNYLTASQFNPSWKKVVLNSPKNTYSAEIHLYGAHLTSFRNNKTKVEHIFLSKEATFEEPKAIRGGVPICWPQFANQGKLSNHGFARNQEWRLVELAQSLTHSWAILRLEESEESKKVGWFNFRLELFVVLGEGELNMELKVHNSGEEDFSFTAALHSYFQVKEITRTTVKGLKGVSYVDKLSGKTLTQSEIETVFDKEVDRIFINAPSPLTIEEGDHTVLTLTKTFPDAVVWNPWVAKSKATSDLGDEEFKGFVCVESGAIKDQVHLKAGETWKAEHTFKVK